MSGVPWRPMETAPRNGTMLRLLVEFTEHPTEDDKTAPTIGANNFDGNGEDCWLFAGWCWEQDCFTQGEGTPVGWLPMFDEAPNAEAKPERTGTVADYSDQHLVERAARYAPRCRTARPRWSQTMETFGLGSTYAQQLCRRFNLDPDEQIPARRP